MLDRAPCAPRVAVDMSVAAAKVIDGIPIRRDVGPF